MNVLGGAGLQYDPGDGNAHRNLPSWVVDWRVRNDNISYWQRLSRSIDCIDPEALRIRNELGGNLDPTSRKIRIPGTALGRFRVYETKNSAFLTPFPKCVTKRMRGGEGFLIQCTRKLKVCQSTRTLPPSTEIWTYPSLRSGDEGHHSLLVFLMTTSLPSGKALRYTIISNAGVGPLRRARPCTNSEICPRA